MKKKKYTGSEIKRLEVLNRKKKVLEDNKIELMKNLQPILYGLEKIRLEIDEIEIY